jgi:hypothetical protein
MDQILGELDDADEEDQQEFANTQQRIEAQEGAVMAHRLANARDTGYTRYPIDRLIHHRTFLRLDPLLCSMGYRVYPVSLALASR